MSRRFSILSLTMSLYFPTMSLADGMYPLDRLPAEKLKDLGIKVSTEDLQKIAQDAVPRFNNGCSSTFVSKKGLIFTNHHCGAGMVAAFQDKIQSENEANHPHYWVARDGFAAVRPEDELKMEGAVIHVYLGQENVSDQLMGLTSIRDPKERYEAIENRKLAIIEDCKKGNPNLKCEIAFENSEAHPFVLFRSEVIDDIRLVWAPADVLGRFGGDTDNWEFPRFSLDFSFFRAYRNGAPYEPSSFVPFSKEGLKPNDPQLIIGYPGSTERNISAATAEAYRDRDFFWGLHVPRDIYTDAISKYFAQESVGVTLQDSGYYSRYVSLQNYNENGRRKSELIDQLNVPAVFRLREEARSSPYLGPISALHRNRYVYQPIVSVLSSLKSPRVSPLFYLVAIDHLRKSPDISGLPIDKKDEVVRQNLKMIQSMIQNKSIEAEKFITAKIFERLYATPNMTPLALKNLRAATENAVQQCLTSANGLDDSGRLTFENFCKDRDLSIYDQMSSYLYTSTLVPYDDEKSAKALAEQFVRGFLSLTPQERFAAKDPLILFLTDIETELTEILENPKKLGEYTWNYWFLNWQNNLLFPRDFPDANATIRLTFGRVTPTYEPVYKEGGPFPHATRLTDWLSHADLAKQKLNPNHPDRPLFDIPENVKVAIADKTSYENKWYFDKDLGDVPVNFVNDLVITGGNSGSGVYNADAKLVGIAFDGTPESIIGDVIKNPAGRSIGVDIRVIAFLADRIIPEAKVILEEAGIQAD